MGRRRGAKSEYAAEVRIISQLRHRYLVRLVGWCHEHRGDFLLVYELMPNGSVDHHLYDKGVPLTWTTRYDIAIGLASAMLYLHVECAQCIVHRDIKRRLGAMSCWMPHSTPSSVTGLAKLVEHSSLPRTIVLVGRLGYLAPECVMTGKASRELGRVKLRRRGIGDRVRSTAGGAQRGARLLEIKQREQS